jgi:cation transporter-like permease
MACTTRDIMRQRLSHNSALFTFICFAGFLFLLCSSFWVLVMELKMWGLVLQIPYVAGLRGNIVSILYGLKVVGQSIS